MDWQPIETAPKDGTRILLYPAFSNGRGQYQGDIGYFYSPGECWYLQNVGHLNGRWRPTHWMPLPPPPDHHDGPQGE